MGESNQNQTDVGASLTAGVRIKDLVYFFIYFVHQTTVQGLQRTFVLNIQHVHDKVENIKGLFDIFNKRK